MSRQRRPNSLVQFIHRRTLEHIGRCPGFKSGSDIFLVRMHGDNDDFGAGADLLQLSRRIDTVQQWHGHIKDHNIGLKLLRGLQERTSVLDGADQLILSFENAAKSFQDQEVIVGQQNARLRHAVLLELAGYELGYGYRVLVSTPPSTCPAPSVRAPSCSATPGAHWVC